MTCYDRIEHDCKKCKHDGKRTCNDECEHNPDLACYFEPKEGD